MGELKDIVRKAYSNKRIATGRIKLNDVDSSVLVIPVGERDNIYEENFDNNNTYAVALAMVDKESGEAFVLIQDFDGNDVGETFWAAISKAFGDKYDIQPLSSTSCWALASYNHNGQGNLLPACWVQGIDPGENIIATGKPNQAKNAFIGIGDTTVENAGDKRYVYAYLGHDLWAGYNRCHTAYNGTLSIDDTFACLDIFSVGGAAIEAPKPEESLPTPEPNHTPVEKKPDDDNYRVGNSKLPYLDAYVDRYVDKK